MTTETNSLSIGTQQTMTSLEIAVVTGKRHKNVMRDIRIMEPAWEKNTGLKFELSSYQDPTGRILPCYRLTRLECLYLATKFSDEARARLVLRWEELERERMQQVARPMTDLEIVSRAFQITRLQLEEQTRKTEEVQSLLDAQKPLVEFAEAVGVSDDECTVAEMAKILCENGIQIGQNRLFKWLRENHYVGTSEHHRNQAYQQWVERGILTVRTSDPWYDDQGEPHYHVKTLVTGKGQRYFINRFIKETAGYGLKTKDLRKETYNYTLF